MRGNRASQSEGPHGATFPVSPSVQDGETEFQRAVLKSPGSSGKRLISSWTDSVKAYCYQPRAPYHVIAQLLDFVVKFPCKQVIPSSLQNMILWWKFQ